MKAKFILLGFFLCLGLVPLAAQGWGVGNGSLPNEFSFRSFSQPISIDIYLGEKIDVFFQDNVGVVKVDIQNELGTSVYQKAVDTSLNDNLSINISNLQKGTYKIAITDKDRKVIRVEKFIVY